MNQRTFGFPREAAIPSVPTTQRPVHPLLMLHTHGPSTGKRDGKSAAGAGVGDEGHIAVVRFGDPLYNGEAQTEAAILAGAGSVGAVKALEDVRGGVGGNAHAGGGDADAEPGIFCFERGRDMAARERVADGVVEQVHHQSAEEFLIAAEGRVLGGGGVEGEGAGGGGGFWGGGAIGP